MKEKLIENDPYNNQVIFEPSRPINNFAASYNKIISASVYPVLQKIIQNLHQIKMTKKLIEITKEIIFYMSEKSTIVTVGSIYK